MMMQSKHLYFCCSSDSHSSAGPRALHLSGRSRLLLHPRPILSGCHRTVHLLGGAAVLGHAALEDDQRLRAHLSVDVGAVQWYLRQCQADSRLLPALEPGHVIQDPPSSGITSIHFHIYITRILVAKMILLLI